MTGAFLIILFIAGLILIIFPARFNKIKPFLPATILLAVFVYFLIKHQIHQFHNADYQTYSWIPEIGLNIEFVADGLSVLSALLVSGIGFLIFLFARDYMKKYDGTGKFYFYLTLFSGAMLGLVLSANMVQMFIFWELTSVLSFFLISFFHEKDTARNAAFQSLFITALGGLSMLAGVIIIGQIAGSYSLQDWIDHAAAIKAHRLYLPSLLLILGGVFTKSAQFPFHFWLPGAMQAPAPVSSYLHSATMVKAGIFLLARLNPVLGGTHEWTFIVPLFGAITMLVGAYFAITQTDLKAMLAYTTIGALGILTLLLGIDTKLSMKAALVFLLVHAFYKATLFMLAGIIEKHTGTREIPKLSGLFYKMPLTYLIAFLALLSMAGLPPMLGFIGKELIYEAKVQSPGIASLILILGVIANILMVSVSFYLAARLFFTTQKIKELIPLRIGFLYLAGPLLLVIFSLVLGFRPNIIDTLIESALSTISSEDVQVKLKIWHGFNQVFFLSLFTVIAGSVISVYLIKFPSIIEYWKRLNSKIFTFRFTEVFTSVIKGLVGISAKGTQRIQHGYHRYYLLTILIFSIGLLFFQLYVTRGWELNTNWGFRPFYIFGLVLVIVVSSVFAVFSVSRLSTIIAMGVAGYGIALIFLYYSAIDLAITQILVETLIVVMFVFILQRLPRFTVLSGKATRLRDAIVALSFGVAMTLLALKAIHVNLNNPISDYFLSQSYDKAHGKNVVNVILVDFRALDTLGEIIVLSIAALGVFVLLKAKPANK